MDILKNSLFPKIDLKRDIKLFPPKFDSRLVNAKKQKKIIKPDLRLENGKH